MNELVFIAFAADAIILWFFPVCRKRGIDSWTFGQVSVFSWFLRKVACQYWKSTPRTNHLLWFYKRIVFFLYLSLLMLQYSVFPWSAGNLASILEPSARSLRFIVKQETWRAISGKSAVKQRSSAFSGFSRSKGEVACDFWTLVKFSWVSLFCRKMAYNFWNYGDSRNLARFLWLFLVYKWSGVRYLYFGEVLFRLPLYSICHAIFGKKVAQSNSTSSNRIASISDIFQCLSNTRISLFTV